MCRHDLGLASRSYSKTTCELLLRGLWLLLQVLGVAPPATLAQCNSKAYGVGRYREGSSLQLSSCQLVYRATCCTPLHPIAPHSTPFHPIAPHSAPFRPIPPHCTPLHPIAPHSTPFHPIPPHSTPLHSCLQTKNLMMNSRACLTTLWASQGQGRCGCATCTFKPVKKRKDKPVPVGVTTTTTALTQELPGMISQDQHWQQHCLD